jgi:hypothetical protein
MGIITNVERAAAKPTMTGVVAIRQDAIAVVSARGAVASRSSITRGAGNGPATAKYAHCLCLGIINDDNDHCSCCHPPPLRCVCRCLQPHALLADINVMATVQDNLPQSKIIRMERRVGNGGWRGGTLQL